MSDDLFSAAGVDFDGGASGDVSGDDSVAPALGSGAEVIAGNGPVGKIKPGYDMIVATDGACSGNPGPGGWAWVEQMSGARASGGAASTTNNIMELTALIEALTYAGPQCNLLIRSDSQYSLNVMTQWAVGWRKRGWRKADKKPVANLELVKRLLELYENRTGRTDVEWVKGHAGDEANELCDSLAVEQSRAHAA
ncbi:MAG: ribonuclease HI [Actinomycetaceae bacterium]|nr:ribonuclease HI [Actinomycetaceae bacterium]